MRKNHAAVLPVTGPLAYLLFPSLSFLVQAIVFKKLVIANGRPSQNSTGHKPMVNPAGVAVMTARKAMRQTAATHCEWFTT